MIRTEQEYQEAVRRSKQDELIVEQERRSYAEAGLTPEQVEIAIQPLLSFQAQLTEEIASYENVSRRNFSEI